MAKKERKPYHERSDLEKVRSQWTKLSGLHADRQSSAAIVRCGTAAEIAANHVIRIEFGNRTDFDDKTIDSFLVWANGLKGKMQNLICPLKFSNNAGDEQFKTLNDLAISINKIRNAIVHRGEFSNHASAEITRAQTKEFINGLIGLYIQGYDVEKWRKPK
jgi:hypothetical protein